MPELSTLPPYGLALLALAKISLPLTILALLLIALAVWPLTTFKEELEPVGEGLLLFSLMMVTGLPAPQ